MNSERLVYEFVAYGSPAAIIYSVLVLSRILKAGVIDTKPGAKPITQTGRPAVYWALISIMMIAPIGLTLAEAVAIEKLFKF